MESEVKGATVLVALFAAVPTFLFVTFVVARLFLTLNDGAALEPWQFILTLSAGLLLGVGVFVALCGTCMRRREG